MLSSIGRPTPWRPSNNTAHRPKDNTRLPDLRERVKLVPEEKKALLEKLADKIIKFVLKFYGVEEKKKTRRTDDRRINILNNTQLSKPLPHRNDGMG